LARVLLALLVGLIGQQGLLAGVEPGPLLLVVEPDVQTAD